MDEEIWDVVTGIARATLNGDVVALNELIADECEAKEDVLVGAAFYSLALPGEFKLEFPDVVVEEALRVEFLREDLVIATLAPDVDLLLNGTPTKPNPDSQRPLELVREEDGQWRMSNCEVIDYESS